MVMVDTETNRKPPKAHSMAEMVTEDTERNRKLLITYHITSHHTPLWVHTQWPRWLLYVGY